MKKYFTIKKLLLVFGIIVVGMQFFQVDMTNPISDNSLDFIEITRPSNGVQFLLNSACYDCHSNKTKYPWYFNIAPVNWWLKHHIDEGREEMNFSYWGTFSGKKKEKKLKECIELINEGEMPLSTYRLTHSQARLTDIQKQVLVSWFESLKASAQ